MDLTSGRTFDVLLFNKAFVEAGLAALNKRAARKGLPLLTWTWGKAETTRRLVPHPEYGWQVECYGDVAHVPLTLSDEIPRFAGWTFLAALEHLDGENVTRVVPGQELPIEYRTRGPVCDHCRASRRRSETYVLRHEDGRTMQVGSTCIADFLGSDAAGKLAAQASMLAAARGLAEGGCEGLGSGGGGGDCTVEGYLPYVSWCIREQGWVSRTAAREQGGSATADRAMTFLTSPRMRKEAECEPTATDVAEAKAAEEWAENLSDAEIDREKGDYLHNLRAIARSGVVSGKSAGLAASMIVAHQRAQGRERARAERAARKPSEFVGEIGKRETWVDVTLDFVTGYETAFGYTTVLKFRTATDDLLVWKASSTDLARGDVGKRYTVTGTVKKHEEYKGEKQTIVSRCNVEAFDPSAPPLAPTPKKRARKGKAAQAVCSDCDGSGCNNCTRACAVN